MCMSRYAAIPVVGCAGGVGVQYFVAALFRAFGWRKWSIDGVRGFTVGTAQPVLAHHVDAQNFIGSSDASCEVHIIGGEYLAFRRLQTCIAGREVQSGFAAPSI